MDANRSKERGFRMTRDEKQNEALGEAGRLERKPKAKKKRKIA